MEMFSKNESKGFVGQDWSNGLGWPYICFLSVIYCRRWFWFRKKKL